MDAVQRVAGAFRSRIDSQISLAPSTGGVGADGDTGDESRNDPDGSRGASISATATDVERVFSLVGEACGALETLADEEAASPSLNPGTSARNEPHPEDMVSLKQLADLQVVIECAMSWGLFPALLRLGCFGAVVSALDGPSLDSRKRAEAFATQVRRPAKTLQLATTTLFAGIETVLGLVPDEREEEQAQWRTLLHKCCAAVARMVRGSHAHFLLLKNLGDLMLAECALRFVLGPKITLQTKEENILFLDLPLSIRVRALLDALQTHQQMSRIASGGDNSSTDRSRRLTAAVGRQLSTTVALDGGVLAVILEMLEHIPHGNIQAFQQVAGLVLGRKEHLPSVARQLCNLVRSATLKNTHVSPPTLSSVTSQQHKIKVLVQRSVAITANEMARRYGTGAVEKHMLPSLAPDLCPRSVLPMNSRATEVRRGAQENDDVINQVRLLDVLLDAAPPSAPLVRALELQVCATFELYAFAHEQHTRGAGEARRFLRLWFAAAPSKISTYLVRVIAAVPYPIGFLGHVWRCQQGGTEATLTTGRPQLRRQLYKSVDGASCWELVEEAHAEHNVAEELKLTAPNTSSSAAKIQFVPDGDDQGSHISEAYAVEQLKEEEYVEADAVEQLALNRISHLLKLLDGFEVFGPLFIATLSGVANIFRDKVVSRRARSDLLFVQSMLDEEAQRCLDKGFRLAKECVKVDELVRVTAELLDACATALGLHTFEEGDEKETTSHGGISDPPMAVLALDVIPVALAIAASLASHDANDELWEDESDNRDGFGVKSNCTKSRFAILSKLLEPLVVLSRLGDGTACTLQATNTSNDALVSRCRELAETALGIRIAVFAASGPMNDGTIEESNNSYAQRIDACYSYDDSMLDPIGKSIAAAQQELHGEHPPMRAMGIDRLRDIVRDGADGPLNISDQHFNAVVAVLTEALSDEDAYVYLTCIRALAACCETNPVTMFPRLITLFTSNEKLKLQSRLRLGEVLKLSAHRAGASLPQFAPQLIGSLCVGAAYKNPASGKTTNETTAVTDEQGRYVQLSSRRSSSVSATKANANSAVCKTEDDTRMLLESSFRSSCFANLADVCALAPWAAFQQASTLVSLAKGALLFESDSGAQANFLGPKAESARQIRRAAAYLLLQIALGAGSLPCHHGLHEIPLSLKELLQVTNAGSTYDSDRVVRLHCDRARAAVDSIVKSFLFPTNTPKVLEVSIPNSTL